MTRAALALFALALPAAALAQTPPVQGPAVPPEVQSEARSTQPQAAPQNVPAHSAPAQSDGPAAPLNPPAAGQPAPAIIAPALPYVPPAQPAPPPPKPADFDTVDKIAAKSPEYATLSRLIQTSGLVPQLEEIGPYTILAPTEGAFAQHPAEAAALQAPGAEARLAAVLRLHVVPGYLDASEMRKQLTAKGGAAQIPTLAGETLIARLQPGGDITIEDRQGHVGRIAGGERLAFNGVLVPIDMIAQPSPPAAPAKRRR